MGFFDNLINKFASSDRLPHVTAEELRIKMYRSEKFLLLDIRTDEELIGEHKAIDGIVHVPIDHLPESLNVLSKYHDTDIVLICKSGNRARIAGRFLHKKGFENVFVLDGGMLTWTSIDHSKPIVIPEETVETRESDLKQSKGSIRGSKRKLAGYTPKTPINTEIENAPAVSDSSTGAPEADLSGDKTTDNDAADTAKAGKSATAKPSAKKGKIKNSARSSSKKNDGTTSKASSKSPKKSTAKKSEPKSSS